MKTSLALAPLLMLFAVSHAYGEDGGGARTGSTSPWMPVQVPEAARGHALCSIAFSDALHGCIVGDHGLCLMTADGGRTWTVSPTGTSATLRSVHFNDPLHGWACGDGDPKSPAPIGHFVMGRRAQSGVLLSTIDAGKSWSIHWIPTNFEIVDVQTRTAPVLQVGITGGDFHLDGDITRSRDGGKTWSSQRCYRAIFSIQTEDKSHWVAVGSPVSVGFIPAPVDPLYTNQKCRALFSSDGGESWQVAQGSDGETCLRAVAITADGTALSVGDQMSVLRSADAGKHWTTVPLSIPRDLTDVAFATTGDGVAVAVGTNGCILVGTASGSSWKAIAAPEDVDYHGLAATPAGFWVVGDKGVIAYARTQDLESAPAIVLAPIGDAKQTKLQGPTARQRALVRIGDTTVVHEKLSGPNPMNADCTIRKTVTSLSGDHFTVTIEVIAGTPPLGMPKKQTVSQDLSDLTTPDEFSIGQSRVEPAVGQMRMKVVVHRLPDETLTRQKTTLACMVLEMTAQTPEGGLNVRTKMWVPLDTLVPMEEFAELERTQESDGPTGKITITQTDTLLSFARGAQSGK